jgi:hypothetical protein
MTDDYSGPERRSDDTRLFMLERDLRSNLKAQEATNRKLDRVIDTLNAIQAEPEQFPAGRALLARANENRSRLDRHDIRLDGLEARQHEADGRDKFTRQVQLILGIAIALITLYQLAKPA